MRKIRWIRHGVLVALILPLAWYGLHGCSDDDSTSPHDGNGQSDMPDIPLPTQPEDVLPQYSDTLLVQEAPVRGFAPDVLACPQALNELTGCVEPILAFSELVTFCGARIDPDRRQTVFVYDGENLARPGLYFELCLRSNFGGVQFWSDCDQMGGAISQDCAVRPVPLLEEIPLVQRLRHWKRIFSARITYPADYSESHSYTEGTSESWGYSFARTLGASAGIWGISLSAQLTETFSHEVTVSSERTVEQTFSSDSIEGKVVHFSAWQLIEIYRLCNSDGSDFTDPAYEFAEIPTISNATAELYLSAVPFDQ